MLNVAISAAREAGNIIVRYSDRIDRLEIKAKSRNDLVSEVDRMAEDTIIEMIRSTYPEHAILAEESGDHPGSQKSPKITWIIDPLDGTTNFLHGLPHYAVSIAISINDVIEHGVIFDPNRNELFYASRGRGARLDGRRLRVTNNTRLEDALLSTGFPFRDFTNYSKWMKSFGTLLPRTRGIRRFGSAALDLAWVAAGRYDGFWELGLHKWDIAAGALLIQEAGGQISDVAGKQDWLESGNIICGTPTIYEKMLAVVQPCCADLQS
jgi:myo-inositol-1(or 4)-monophosphatase